MGGSFAGLRGRGGLLLVLLLSLLLLLLLVVVGFLSLGGVDLMGC